jgi:hypothetical protein
MELTINGETIVLNEEQRGLLKATASKKTSEAVEHRQALAQVMERAWKAGVLEPDLLGNVFQRIILPPGVEAKFPFDFYGPTNEGSYEAFVMPKEGAVPDRVIEGDEIRVPTYKLANAISWSLDYARDARWDVVARAIEVFTNGFVRKLNDDGWHVILKVASEGTTTLVDDTAATSGVFSKQLLLNMMTSIKRRTGGRNSRLTDLYLSPEAIADIRNFDNTLLDEVSRREVLTSSEDRLPELYGVRFHEIQEFGALQEYETYLSSTLGRAHTNSKGEYVLGLDLLHRDAFVMPVREEMQMFDDPTLHRSAKAGVYGWMEIGFAALDTRRAVLGQL